MAGIQNSQRQCCGGTYHMPINVKPASSAGNSLFATTGCGQVRPDGSCEPPLVTLGTDIRFLNHLDRDYGAEDALDYLRTQVSNPT